MKLNRFETHDRLLHLKKDQARNIAQGAEDCLKKNRLSLALQERSPYIYIFAHPRTADDGVTKRMLWQPRLTRPEAQTNSYLFRAQSKTDIMEICWLLPPQEMWAQYKKGNVTEHEWVLWSINQYRTNSIQLGAPLQDDLPEHACKAIYHQIATELNEELQIEKLYSSKQPTSEEFPTSS